MQARNVTLATPLKIDVEKIATLYPEFRYRGPYQDWMSKTITSEYILNDGDQDKMGVLFFDKKTYDGFNTITSYYSQKELAVLFTRLPQELSSPLISALKGTALEIPTLSERESKEISKEYDARKARLEKLTSLQAPLKATHSVDFKSSEAVGVLQHEYAVTNADSQQPILGTSGTGSCVILALYDAQNRKAV